MSYDKSEIEYCLTLRGWVTIHNLAIDEVVVERWVEKACQGSGFGKESVKPEMLRANPEFTTEQRAALQSKFPAPWSEEAQAKAKQEFSKFLEQWTKAQRISD